MLALRCLGLQRLPIGAQGPFNKKLLRRSTFAAKHFNLSDANCPFIYMEDDPITKTKVSGVLAAV